MNELDESKAVSELDAIIDEFIDRSKIFVQASCYLPGLRDIRKGLKTIRHVYDHEYLAFTKSAKTLISIRNLLDLGNGEDVYVLVRSIFENYLAARFINENVHTISDLPLLEEYIQNRIKISSGYYSVKHSKVLDEQGKQVAKTRSIRSQRLELDKLYYDMFYGYISRFAHLDFSNLDYYLDDDQGFTINKESDEVLTRLFTVFVYTKLFETIVTIENEDFYDEFEEEKCYKIVSDSLILQRRLFHEYIQSLNFEVEDNVFDQHRLNLQFMLSNMNRSLEDNIGDFNKDGLF
ncbi:DUF5677 domain-containing protein [Lysinibacillus sp. CNPSo 3705]|uniref:DUF5677 domain-containing protein n=1 Tax=Lysinibacillus sp. CNPSo 3705 TaxID=3028148 RepID=UPI002363C137|nr:DUF5677 domain-containing protein [Lysinibacillus sp. CNPSo 3705]MDD1504260.1 DUF5677 domain-containing protein [Lysinibacillus sp. CNPSo 3705]